MHFFRRDASDLRILKQHQMHGGNGLDLATAMGSCALHHLMIEDFLSLRECVFPTRGLHVSLFLYSIAAFTVVS